jgi:hypothetical protein
VAFVRAGGFFLAILLQLVYGFYRLGVDEKKFITVYFFDPRVFAGAKQEQ